MNATDTAAAIVSAVRAVDQDGDFGEALGFTAAGTWLGEVGDALREGADKVAELRVARLLRLAEPEDISNVLHDLKNVDEAPWPAFRAALDELGA